MSANPISGPYQVTSSIYHTEPGEYNRVVLAASTFIATGSNANPVAFLVSGSTAATVTLINGGTISVPASNIPYNMGVYSVTAGTVYLLYKG
jgi:hypothetical protein